MQTLEELAEQAEPPRPSFKTAQACWLERELLPEINYCPSSGSSLSHHHHRPGPLWLLPIAPAKWSQGLPFPLISPFSAFVLCWCIWLADTKVWCLRPRGGWEVYLFLVLEKVSIGLRADTAVTYSHHHLRKQPAENPFYGGIQYRKKI